MQIICSKCKKSKNESEFYKANNFTGREAACKSCRGIIKYQTRRQKRIDTGLYIKFPALEARELLKEGKKYCPTCKEIKLLEEFSTMQVRDGIASHCKSCNRSAMKEYNSLPQVKEKKRQIYLANKIKQKNAKLLREFGISYEDYLKILAEQNGVCAICHKTPEQNKKMLAVDHDHSTKVNRGLLCSSCNICIGFLEKNKLDISAIMDYAIKHKIKLG